MRSAVIALVASASSVLVLAGITAGVFATPSLDQTIPVDERVTGRPSTLAFPDQPVPLAPAGQAPPPAPAAPLVEGPPPAPVDPPAVAAPRKPAHREPAVRPVSYRPPVQLQPAPAPRQPAPPLQRPEPVAHPPASTSPAASKASRTVNTEPCSCDGRMRRVPTHWDPPRS